MGRNLKTRKPVTLESAEAPFAREMDELSTLVAQLKEEEALAMVRQSMEAGVPAAEIFSACQKGMRTVGSMHEKGVYFIAGLIMAGEIMREALDILRPVIRRGRPEKSLGRVLLGTIKGDIHDIGKNLFKDLLESHGFTVLDLGVDVEPAGFIKAAADFHPHLIAVSVLITSSFPFLRELVDLFHHATTDRAERPSIIIGGGQVDERISSVSGSDYWAQDAFVGLKLCLSLAADFKCNDK